MKKTARKDLFRLIGSTKMFYLTMVVVSAIAVMAYTGISYSTDSLKSSCEQYYDDNSFYDLQLGSVYGFTDDKLDTIRNNEKIKEAEASYYTQELIDVKEDEYVAEFYTQAGALNQVHIEQGTVPQNASECMVEQAFLDRFDLKIGDKIQLSDPSTMLSKKIFKIVGSADLVTVFATNDFYNRGISDLGDGQVTTKIMVTESSFQKDAVKRICYMTIKDRPLRSSQEYIDQVNKVKEELIPILEKMDEKDFEEKKWNLNQQLTDGQIKYDNGEKELENASFTIANAQGELEDAKKQLTQKEQELLNGKEELSNASFTLEEYENQLNYYRNTLDNTKIQLDSARNQLDEAKGKLKDSRTKLDTSKEQLESAKKELDSTKEQLQSAENTLNTYKQQLDEGKEKLDSLASYIDLIQSHIDSTDEKMSEVQEKINDPDYESSRDDLMFQYEVLSTEKELLESALKSVTNEFQNSNETYEKSLREYNEKQAEYEEGLALYNEKEAEYQSSLTLYEAGEIEYENGLASYEAQKNKYDQSMSSYQIAESDYALKEEELNQKKKQYNISKEELVSGEGQIIKGQSQIFESEKELSNKEKELDAQKQNLQKAKQELDDAQNAIEMLPKGKIYVSDIFSNASYNYFIQSSNGTDTVVGVLSFLLLAIASLVCYTTISRLVTEQHRLIGAQKAFGFRPEEIYTKYISYVASATFLGCFVGMIGSYTFMQRIVFQLCYGQAFILKDFKPILEWKETMILFVAEIICMSLSAFLACRQMLKKNAIDLINSNIRSKMKEKTATKNVLPLSLKMTLRNLRSNPQILLTTIVSVFGCTFLMITVMTVRDGMAGIAPRQFDQLQSYNGTLTINKDKSEKDKNEIENYIESNEEVDALPVLEKLVSFQGKKKIDYATIICLNPNEDNSNFIQLIDVNTNKEMEVPKEGIYVCKKMAEINDLKVGDTLEVKDNSGITYGMNIAGIFDRNIGMAIVSSDCYLNSVLDNPIEFNQFYVKGKDASIETFIKNAKTYTAYSSWQDSRYFEKEMEFKVNCVNQVILVLLGIIGLLSLFVLSNLSLMNIKKKEKEIVTMKVLGFPKKRIYTYVFRESMAMCMIGLVLGFLAGSLLGSFIASQIELETLQTIRGIHVGSCVFGALINFVFFTGSNLISLRRIQKIKMVGSVREA